MAQRLKAGDEHGEITRAHNATEQKKIIAEVASVVRPLLEKRQAISGEIREAKSRLKAIGVKSRDFDAMLRLADLEPEDRDDSLRAIRLCFEGLNIGAQGTLFPENIADAAE